MSGHGPRDAERHTEPGSRSARFLFDSLCLDNSRLALSAPPLFSPPPFSSRNSTSIAIMSTTATIEQPPSSITAENVLRLFPEVNTTLIGGTHASAARGDDLEGYDEEQ